MTQSETGESIENFADKNTISDWANPYVSAVVKASLINGKSDGELLNFAPKDTLTRAEAMTILGRTLEKTIGVAPVGCAEGSLMTIPVYPIRGSTIL